MSFFDRLVTSKHSFSASREITSLLKDAGLFDTPFSIEFLEDGNMAITLVRDADDPHRYEMSPDDELNVLSIASIFGNSTAQRGLTFRTGSTFDWSSSRGH
jgi:hypothetical protein